MSARGQRGVALFTAIFLVVVIAALAATVAVVTTTQQVGSGRALDASGALHAARARLEREIAATATSAPGSGTCPATGAGSQTDIAGFTTELERCDAITVNEGGADYEVFTLRAAAFRGDRASGTLVRRELRAVVTNRD